MRGAQTAASMFIRTMLWEKSSEVPADISASTPREAVVSIDRLKPAALGS